MKLIDLLFFILLCLASHAQQPVMLEQQLENIADETEEVTEDDMYMQELSRFLKEPVNINSAGSEALAELRILTDLQIDNFLSYRHLLGTIIDSYELQAVPGWDIETIRKLLPYISLSVSFNAAKEINKLVKGGEHSIILRVGQAINKTANHDTSAGSPQRLFFRYRYTYKNLLQYGLAGDKDAGERFFGGAQRLGFDFYTFYLFIRKTGILQSIALGDFTINLGQGLIQWQSMAFKKSGDVLAIKRQSAPLRPYNSAGEFNFLRGCGISVQKGRIAAIAFVSWRKLSATSSIDSNGNAISFSSFQTSGYHRTATEIRNRNNLGQLTIGGNLNYRHGFLKIGVNAVYYRFTMNLIKQDEPYNLFAWQGDNWYNTSIEYSYTYRNLHVFGEAALDKNLQAAFINGALLSLDSRIAISLLHRLIPMQYRAVNANAFTENTSPANENGCYAGISIRPTQVLRCEAYADVYAFPWLRFQVDAPSSGRDYLVQFTYTPTRKAEFIFRYKSEVKQGQTAANDEATKALVFNARKSARVQINYKLNPAISIRHRVETVWYNQYLINAQNGFLTYVDFIFKPQLKPFSIQARWQHFETDGYDARLYAYENDVLYSYSMPSNSGNGMRYYVLLSYDVTKKISGWLRWAATISNNGDGEPQSGELKGQIRISF